MERKRSLLKLYSAIQVKLGNVYLYRQDGLITAIFTQAYRSDKFSAGGIKVLYIEDKSKLRIYAEDFHQPVDDTCPVRSYLARYGVEVAPTMEHRPDFKIRLVSTDDPERTAPDGVERPMPVAPSRGAVLERVDSKGRDGPSAPAISENLKLAVVAPSEAIVEARAVQDADLPALGLARRPAAQLLAESKREPLHSPGRGLAANTAASKQAQGGQASAAPAPGGQGGEVPAKEERPTDSPGGDDKHDPEGEFDLPEGEIVAVKDFLRGWKDCWERKDLDSFLKMYDPNFRTGAIDYAKLGESKKGFFSKYRVVRVELDQIQVKRVKGQYHVKFHQTFRGDNYRDKGWKSMVLAGGKNKGFRILGEKWSPS
jgi:hypothetical protein